MEVLKLTLLALPLAACYSPDLRDCVVQCASASDCAGDQFCSSGLCTGGDSCAALNGVDGDISPTSEVDAGADAPRDTMPVDSMPIDSMPSNMATITISISGPDGRVMVMGGTTCTSATQPCTVTLTKGPHVFHAMEGRPDKPFESWESALCSGQGMMCNAMVVGDAPLAAKFH